MGYIAPITNYQYTQYAERDIGTEHDPFHFVPVNRINHTVNAHPFQHSLLFDQPMKKRSRRVTRDSSVYQKNTNNASVEKAFAEITGKGRNFSKSV